MKVVMVCFANTCRSPVAESLLASFVAHDPTVSVTSKGVMGGDGATPVALGDVLASRGIALQSPSGERLGDEPRDGDLYLFMERALLREAVVTQPNLWPKSFTLREFARRAQLNPPERDSERFADWLGVLHGSRQRSDLMGDDPIDDVADPGLRGDTAEFATMVDELESLCRRIAPFLTDWSGGA